MEFKKEDLMKLSSCDYCGIVVDLNSFSMEPNKWVKYRKDCPCKIPGTRYDRPQDMCSARMRSEDEGFDHSDFSALCKYQDRCPMVYWRKK